VATVIRRDMANTFVSYRSTFTGATRLAEANWGRSSVDNSMVLKLVVITSEPGNAICGEAFVTVGLL
jgi:hypothetical protein